MSVKTHKRQALLALGSGLLVVPLLASSLANAEGDWSLTGYVKSYALVRSEADIAGLEDYQPDNTAEWQNALRLMMGGDLSDSLSLEFHYEIKPVYLSSSFAGDLTGLGGTVTSNSSNLRFKDINNEMVSDDGRSILRQNLDRLNVRFEMASADLTIGRQALNVGSARFINPTDIFEPFLVATLDTEYRTGIDAVRLQGPLGDFAEYDFGYIVGRDGEWENSAVYARAKTGGMDGDFEAILIHREAMTLVGGGIESALGNLGVWAEVAYSFSADDDNYARASLGFDQAINEDLLMMTEYHYSGAGASDPEDYLSDLGKTAFSDGGVRLLGEHYLISSLAWTADPLTTIGASAHINLGDGSALLQAQANYSLTDDLYMDLGLIYGFGDGASVSFAPPSSELGSEFGSLPPTLYASIRYYF